MTHPPHLARYLVDACWRSPHLLLEPARITMLIGSDTTAHREYLAVIGQFLLAAVGQNLMATHKWVQ